MSYCKTAQVAYQIGEYKGTVYVNCTEDDESETIKAMARKSAYKRIGGSLGMAYESFTIKEIR